MIRTKTEEKIEVVSRLNYFSFGEGGCPNIVHRCT